MKYATVTVQGGSVRYSYIIPEHLKGLCSGQRVVVPFGAAYEYRVGIVRAVKIRDPLATKEIVCIVDDREYKKNIVERARRKTLEQQLKKRLADACRNDWLELLKQKDPSSMNLIREYESLMEYSE